MSDPDTAPDPIDTAYLEAEALLSDEAARAARRERVLAAVARQGAPDAPASATRLWRRGGWLVAASVSGLALVVASQLYRPSPHPPSTKPAAVPAASRAGATVQSPAPAQFSARQTKAVSRAVRLEPGYPPSIVASSPPPPAALPAAGPGPQAFPGAEPAPPTSAPRKGDAIASAEAAAPLAQSAPKQPPPPAAQAAGATVSEMVVPAEKREVRRQSAPAAIGAFAGQSRDVPDPGALLRAAAAGRTDEVQSLLEHGAPIDSTDADGDTALMKSIEADHPATAAFLRRRGASLNQTNRAGESARDMARAKGDAQLDQAIGLSP